MYNKESEETKSASSRSLRSSLSSVPGPGELTLSIPPAFFQSLLSVPDHLRCIRSNQTGRSLIELTGDNDIFVYLHKYFLFLLKAGGQRVTECVLEGPPQVVLYTQCIDWFDWFD